MMVNDISLDLIPLLSTSLIIVHDINPHNNIRLESGELLDRAFCILQEKEALLRKRLYQNDLTLDQYISSQAELDEVCHQMALILQEQKVRESVATD